MTTESANLPDPATWTWFDRDTTRETKAERAHDKGFIQGCALAVATLIRLHGESVEARDLCRELGVNGIAYLKSNDVEPYDLEVLIPFIQKEFVEREARIAESKRLRGSDV